MTGEGALVRRIVGLLDEVSIPHMVVGSLASSFHGEPRQTRDIDIVIDPTPEALRRFVDRWVRALGIEDAWARAREVANPT